MAASQYKIGGFSLKELGCVTALLGGMTYIACSRLVDFRPKPETQVPVRVPYSPQTQAPRKYLGMPGSDVLRIYSLNPDQFGAAREIRVEYGSVSRQWLSQYNCRLVCPQLDLVVPLPNDPSLNATQTTFPKPEFVSGVDFSLIGTDPVTGLEKRLVTVHVEESKSD